MPSLSDNPSRRTAVQTWYDSIYFSLVENKEELEPDVKALVEYSIKNANNLNKKQVSAHMICYYKILKDAKKLSLPTIDYSVLLDFNKQSLRNYLNDMKLWRLIDVELLSKKIIKTRKKRQDKFSNMNCQDYKKELQKLITFYNSNSIINFF